MSKHWSTVVVVGICAIVCVAILGVMGLLCEQNLSKGIETGRKSAYTEAVKAGVARWVLDEKGESKLEWIIPKERN
jgi:hypothetical protein